MEQKMNVEEGSYLYIIQNTPSLQPHFQRKRNQSPILILGSLPSSHPGECRQNVQ